MTGLWVISYIVLWILFLVVAIALLSILRNLGVIYESLVTTRATSVGNTKLVAGEALPNLTLQTLAGEPITLSKFESVKAAFSIVSPECVPCHRFLRAIATDRAVIDPLDSSVRQRIIISVGDPLATEALARLVQLPHHLPVMVDIGHSIADMWGVTTTPTTVIVDENFRVVRHLAGAPEAVMAHG
jgi:hypothetical protein